MTQPISDETIDRLCERLNVDAEVRPNGTDVRSFMTVSPFRLAELETDARRSYLALAEQAAPARVLLQAAQEFLAIRLARLVGQAAAIESAELTEAVVSAGATTMLYAQVLKDGLRGKVDDEALALISELTAIGGQGLAAIQLAGQQLLLRQVSEFEPPSTVVSNREVVTAKLRGRMPDSRILKG